MPQRRLIRDEDSSATADHVEHINNKSNNDIFGPIVHVDFFEAAGIPENVAKQATARTDKWHTSLRKSISLERRNDEALSYWNLARNLGVPYCANVTATTEPSTKTPSNLAAARKLLSNNSWNGFVDTKRPHRFAIAPEPEDWARLTGMLVNFPELRSYISIACPARIRETVTQTHLPSLLKIALTHLEATLPGQCAAIVLTSLQSAFVLLAFTGLLGCWLLFPQGTHFALMFFLAVFFAGCVALRIVASIHCCMRRNPEPPPLADHDLPKYTVLVPLYKEAGIAPQLIENLQNIDYPDEQLDIKIILEEDDEDTITAVQRHSPGTPFDVILVPSAAPKTKPKALNYALNFSEGDLVCIFDAEDRPDPDQLRRAAALLMSDARVGAVQCVLTIKNGDESWLSRLFAIEYEALFNGLLPTLDFYAMPAPLGGTSNHFRRSVLESVGAWDPYNVTEDADLGIRLARHGYRSTTLPVETVEEAPITFSQWLPQRTRWFKGWVQSWLVHMRNPVKLFRELGLINFCAVQIVVCGMFLSAALHPIFAYVAITDLLGWIDGSNNTTSPFQKILQGLNFFNFVAGYVASMILAATALIVGGNIRWLPSVLRLPLYWWLMSLAAWRALWQLIHDPFKWEKTDHGVSNVTD